MLYVFKDGNSNGARDLAESITATNARRIRDLGRAHHGVGLRPGDRVVSWGAAVTPVPGIPILNGGPIRNKLTDAQVLARANVPTIQVHVGRTPPAAPTVLATDPALTLTNDLMDALEDYQLPRVVGDQNRSTILRNPVHLAALTELEGRIRSFREALGRPVPMVAAGPSAAWVGRTNNHVGGNDLLRPVPVPDFWARKEELTSEVRIHSFLHRSIRAGQKQQRTAAQGFTGTPHTWIRSYDGGWFINYDGYESTRQMRELADSAVTALGLDFGAVDIGVKADGTLIVLEVNRAPGLEGGTVEAYANAVSKWAAGEWTAENYERPAPRATARGTATRRAA